MLKNLALETFSALLFLLPIYLILNRSCIRNGRQTLRYGLFSLYLCAVYSLVGLPNVTYVRFDVNLNLIPFSGMMEGLRSTILNIALFVPLGILLPLLWEKYWNPKATLTFGFCLSALIEVFQLFTYRASDVNDLITNTAGTALGFWLIHFMIKRIPNPFGITAEKNSFGLALSCGAAAAVMFFAQPVFLSFLWKLF